MAYRVTQLRTLLIVAIAWLPMLGDAHEMRPGYLEIRETAADTYEVLWKVPAQGDDLRMGLYLRFDDDVSSITEPVAAFVGSTHTQRLRIKRDGGLTGSTISIDGLAATLTDVLLRHILSGVDHLLFVLALLMVVVGWRRLVGTVTAFTVAHSITLALAALGIVQVPGAPVEAIIALSIVFVAAEIIRARQGNPGLTARLPWIVAFTFGLLHGFGFAGALSEIGLPQASIPLALFTFNVGVEIGQLFFIIAVLGLYAIGKRLQPMPPDWAWRAPSYAIGGIAAFWVFERVAAFWS
jgi:hypothetical protein